MQCLQCQADNQPHAKFCGECGGWLASSCRRCAGPLPPAARFCPECAEPTGPRSAADARFASPRVYTPQDLAERMLGARESLEGERKQVTVLFADLKSSLELLADRDPEEARQILDPILEALMEAVHHYEGTVNQVLGDGIMALFGAPLAHEDHALRACHAALRMQDSVRRSVSGSTGLPVPVQIRVGINSGEVIVRTIRSDLRMDYTAVGQTTHMAARMEQIAQPGTTLLTRETLQLVRGYVTVRSTGSMTVKGLPGPIEAYELIGPGPARSRLQAAAMRGLTRFVGREGELAILQTTAERAAGGHGQVVCIVGEPGVGKSRLVREFLSEDLTAPWRVIETASVSYGQATPYLPIVALLRDYFGIEAGADLTSVPERIAARLREIDETLVPGTPVVCALLDVPVPDETWNTLDPTQRRRRILDFLRRLILRESQAQPLCLVMEDLHWIDSESQSLLDRLIESLPTARLLCLVSCRPGVRPRLDEPELLHPDPARAARAGPGPRDPRRAPGPRAHARRAQGAAHRPDRGQPVLPGGERLASGGDGCVDRRARRVSPRASHTRRAGARHRPRRPRRPHRSPPGAGEAPAAGRRGRREGRPATPARRDRGHGRRGAAARPAALQSAELLYEVPRFPRPSTPSSTP